MQSDLRLLISNKEINLREVPQYSSGSLQWYRLNVCLEKQDELFYWEDTGGQNDTTIKKPQ